MGMEWLAESWQLLAVPLRETWSWAVSEMLGLGLFVLSHDVAAGLILGLSTDVRCPVPAAGRASRARQLLPLARHDILT